MADEETVTTGTETPPPEAAEKAAAGTEGAAGEGAEKVSISAHEYGVLRDARAREKALQTELDRLKAETESRTTPTTDTREDVASMTPAEVKAYKAKLYDSWKKGGSEDAGAVLASIISSEQATASNRQIMFELQMRDIPEGKRDAVKKYMAETGAPTPGIAYDLMRGKEAPSLEQKVADLEKQLAEAKKGKGRVEGTRIAGLPAGDVDDGVPALTLDEYNERMRKDPNKTITERRTGKFRLKDS